MHVHVANYSIFLIKPSTQGLAFATETTKKIIYVLVRLFTYRKIGRGGLGVGIRRDEIKLDNLLRYLKFGSAIFPLSIKVGPKRPIYHDLK